MAGTGCMLNAYKPSMPGQCLAGRLAVFIGKLVAWVLSITANGQANHSDRALKIGGIKWRYIWDPYLNSITWSKIILGNYVSWGCSQASRHESRGITASRSLCPGWPTSMLALAMKLYSCQSNIPRCTTLTNSLNIGCTQTKSMTWRPTSVINSTPAPPHPSQFLQSWTWSPKQLLQKLKTDCTTQVHWQTFKQQSNLEEISSQQDILLPISSAELDSNHPLTLPIGLETSQNLPQSLPRFTASCSQLFVSFKLREF